MKHDTTLKRKVFPPAYFVLLQGLVCVVQIIGLMCHPSFIAPYMPRMDAPHRGNFATDLFWWGVVLVPALLPFLFIPLTLWFIVGYGVTTEQKVGYSLATVLLTLLTWALAGWGVADTALTFD